MHTFPSLAFCLCFSATVSLSHCLCLPLCHCLYLIASRVGYWYGFQGPGLGSVYIRWRNESFETCRILLGVTKCDFHCEISNVFGMVVWYLIVTKISVEHFQNTTRRGLLHWVWWYLITRMGNGLSRNIPLYIFLCGGLMPQNTQ